MIVRRRELRVVLELSTQTGPRREYLTLVQALELQAQLEAAVVDLARVIDVRVEPLRRELAEDRAERQRIGVEPEPFGGAGEE